MQRQTSSGFSKQAASRVAWKSLLFAVFIAAGGAYSSGANRRITASVQRVTASNDPWLNTPAFHSYFFATKIVQEVNGTGVNVYSIDTNLLGDETGLSGGDVSPSSGVWDFSALKRILDMIVAVNPNAKFDIRPYAGATTWWKNANPGELEQYSDGCVYFGTKKNNSGVCVTSTGAVPSEPGQLRYGSTASTVLMQQWKAGLQALRSALDQYGYTSRVQSITLIGLSSQEWICWDALFTAYQDQAHRPFLYSSPQRQAYLQWLQNKYGTSSGRDLPTEAEFTAVNFPAAGSSVFDNLSQSQNVVDYYAFRGELVANTIVSLAQQAKTSFPGVKVGAIYGYMNEMGGDPSFGHNALHILLASSYIDFINPMMGYQDRIVGGAEMERQPISSVALNNKLIATDLDHGTALSKQNYDGICAQYPTSSDFYKVNCNSGDPSSLYAWIMALLGFRIDGSNNVITPTLYDDVSNFRRFLGYSIVRDIRFTYLSLHNDYWDVGNEKSYLSDPYMLSTVVPQINQTKAQSFNYDRSSAAEILVVSDEDSNAYTRYWIVGENLPDRTQNTGGLTYQALLISRVGLNMMGAPYDHILMSDLDKIDPSPYKLVIFLNAWNVGSATRSLIQSKLETGNKVIVWNYAAGLIKDGVKAMQNSTDLVGMTISDASQIKAPAITISTSAVSPFSQNYSVSPNYYASCCDTLYASDSSGISVLGYYPGTTYPSMALKSFSNWKSLWTATVTLPPAAWRDIAKFAGAHIYDSIDEPFYANKSYVTVVASSNGSRTIQFPAVVDVYEPVSNSLLVSGVSSYTFTTSNAATYIFRMQTPGVPARSSLNSVHSFPNPFKPSLGHDRITFRGLTTNATIKIYSLSGELVQTLSKSDSSTQDLVWNPVANSKGQSLASGIYLFVVSGDSGSASGKLIIVK